MWSEHCSYKSSKVHLQTLPAAGAAVLQGPGENAGVVDLGDGLAAVFKVESHNHPSFIEPYQGAATGVGGIIRDVFTMGARPIALMHSLRFGPPDAPRMKHLVKGFGLGTAPADRLFKAKASGIGNPVVYVGSHTGRDGIHGATMASAAFE